MRQESPSPSDQHVPLRIRIGPAGWSYPDWEWQVYPKPKPRGFDLLAYLAQYVDTIEINSPFSRIPPATMTKSWGTRVSDHPTLRFIAKLCRASRTRGRPAPMTEDHAHECRLCAGVCP